jgi:hypothetical protein
MQDISEFMTRMRWMHEEYNAAIEILFGVPDKEITATINDWYESLFNADEDCIAMLMQ